MSAQSMREEESGMKKSSVLALSQMPGKAAFMRERRELGSPGIHLSHRHLYPAVYVLRSSVLYNDGIIRA